MPPLPPDGTSKAGETIGSTPDAAPCYPVPAGYRVLRKLGEGGMGAVFLALDERLEREVALKYLLSQDAETRGRFRREGRLLAQLKHPNIVEVFASEVIDDIPILACEYVDGEDLKSWLRRAGPVAACERGLEIAEHILEALAHAHGAGVVHRDLKSENVLLSKKGETKLADFGIAAGGEGGTVKTRAGQVFGTPAYMAPEQIDSMAVDGRADLYSFGVILFEIFTGRLPFEHPDMMQLLRMQQAQPPPRPERVAPWIPLSLSTVILRLLQKDPAARYPDAAEVLDAIRAIPDEDRRFLVTRSTQAGQVRPAPEGAAEGRALRRTRSTGAARTIVSPPSHEGRGSRRWLAAVASGICLGVLVFHLGDRSSGVPIAPSPSTPPGREAPAPVSIALLEHRILVGDEQVYFLGLTSRPVELKLGMSRTSNVEDAGRSVADGASLSSAVWHVIPLSRSGSMKRSCTVEIELEGVSPRAALTPGMVTIALPSKEELEEQEARFVASKQMFEQEGEQFGASDDLDRLIAQESVIPPEVFLATNKKKPDSGLLITLLERQGFKRELIAWDPSAEHSRRQRKSSLRYLIEVAGLVGSCHPDIRFRQRVAAPLRDELSLDGFPRPIPSGPRGEVESFEDQIKFVADAFDLSERLVRALCMLSVDLEENRQTVRRFFESGWEDTCRRFEKAGRASSSYRAMLLGAAVHLARYRPEWARDIAHTLRTRKSGDLRAAAATMEVVRVEETGLLETFLVRRSADESQDARERTGALHGLVQGGGRALEARLFSRWVERERLFLEKHLTESLLDPEAIQISKAAYRRLLLGAAHARDASDAGEKSGSSSLMQLLELLRNHRPRWEGDSWMPEDLPDGSQAADRTMLALGGRLFRTISYGLRPEVLDIMIEGAPSRPSCTMQQLVRGFTERSLGATPEDVAAWPPALKRAIEGYVREHLPAPGEPGELFRRDPQGNLVLAAAVLGIPGWRDWARILSRQQNRWMAWVGSLCLEGEGVLFGGDAPPAGTPAELPASRRILRQFFGKCRSEPGTRSRWIVLDPTLPSRPARMRVENGTRLRLRGMGLAFPNCSGAGDEYARIRLDRGDPHDSSPGLSCPGMVRLEIEVGPFRREVTRGEGPGAAGSLLDWSCEVPVAGDLRLQAWLEAHGRFSDIDEEETAKLMQHEGMVLVQIVEEK